jgi:hypothetical protein
VAVIVRGQDAALTLITQPDHAHLADRIMRHATALADATRRDSIALAIAEHDNGWAEADAAPIIDPDSGGVADFVVVPLAVRHDVWPRGIKRLAHDPWAAALVAQHAITVYDRYRSHAAWTPFFAEMESLRDAMVASRGLPERDLLDDYPFVRLGDLISLAFCTGWSEPQRFEGWTVHRVGDRVSVSPRTFGGRTIPFEIAAKQLPRRAFSSDEDLRAAVAKADAITLRGEVVDA